MLLLRHFRQQGGKMNLKNRSFFGLLCLSLVLLAQATPGHAEAPVLPPDPPDGPYAISINVFIDPYYRPKMENVKIALEETSKSLKEHLNLEITWYIHGRLFGITKWHPADNTELNLVLSKKVGHLVKADANIIFTNRNWIDKFCFPGFGHVTCEKSSVHGYFYQGADTIVVYHTDRCTGTKAGMAWIECDSNGVVDQHEIGHFLGLSHDTNPLSIMYPEFNPDGGQWLPHNVKAAKRSLCFRGYLKCK